MMVVSAALSSTMSTFININIASLFEENLNLSNLYENLLFNKQALSKSSIVKKSNLYFMINQILNHRNYSNFIKQKNYLLNLFLNHQTSINKSQHLEVVFASFLYFLEFLCGISIRNSRKNYRYRNRRSYSLCSRPYKRHNYGYFDRF